MILRFWHSYKKCGISSFTVSDVSSCKTHLRQNELIKLGRDIKEGLIITQIFITYPDGSDEKAIKGF